MWSTKSKPGDETQQTWNNTVVNTIGYNEEINELITEIIGDGGRHAN